MWKAMPLLSESALCISSDTPSNALRNWMYASISTDSSTVNCSFSLAAVNSSAVGLSSLATLRKSIEPKKVSFNSTTFAGSERSWAVAIANLAATSLSALPEASVSFLVNSLYKLTAAALVAWACFKYLSCISFATPGFAWWKAVASSKSSLNWFM